MQSLPGELRNQLAAVVKAARRTGEAGARSALGVLAVGDARPHPSLSPDEQDLRRRLRAHGRQLGDRLDAENGVQQVARLAHEVAYEHWHRMLFARFLAENDLLIEPDSGVAVSLTECEELARERDQDCWTVAGRFALLGTREPQRWLPHAFIQSVAYRGVSVSDAMGSPRYQLDAKDNDGPLDDQIEYACRFVARNQRVEASKHLGRIDWPQYDLAAVFEAVVNAVAHRDYSRRGSKVRLRMFSDRIELYSPGAPANGMRLDEIAYKQNARNPAVANLLKRCAVAEEIVAPRGTMMDRRGAGVPAILARSRRISGRQPVYELFGDELRLTIYAADPAAGDSV